MNKIVIVILFILIISLGLIAGYKSNWQSCNDYKVCNIK